MTTDVSVSGSPLTNWAGSHRYSAPQLHRPQTVAELCEVVAGSDHVRPLGSRHSFSDIADSPGALASLPHISVAGAVATGTHGSGDRVGSLASSVASLEYVAPDGQLRTAGRGDTDFEGQVVDMGALGIVTHVTLDIEPTFNMRQGVFLRLPWDVALSRLDTVTAAAYSVSMFTYWDEDEVAQVRRTCCAVPPPRR